MTRILARKGNVWMREGVDWALGIRAGVVTREAARTERALMAWPGRMVGGTLTLSNGRLDWQRSAWALPSALPLLGLVLAVLMNRGPGSVSLDAEQLAVAPVGRMIPWRHLLFLSLTWWGIGLLISAPLFLLRGGSRRCIAVHSSETGETYSFAVRDVNGWLADLSAGGARKAALLPWRLPQPVEMVSEEAVPPARGAALVRGE